MKILKSLIHFLIVVVCADYYHLALSRKSSCMSRTDNKASNSSLYVMPFFDGGLSYDFHPFVINPAISWPRLRLLLRNLFAHITDVAKEMIFKS